MYDCNLLIITRQFSYCHTLLGCRCKSKIIPSNPSKHAILSLYPLPTLNQITNILIYKSLQDLKVYKVNTSKQNSSRYRGSCCLFLRFCRCLFHKKRSRWPMVLLPPPIIAPSSSGHLQKEFMTHCTSTSTHHCSIKLWPICKNTWTIASYRDLGPSPEVANHPLRPVNHRICIYWGKINPQT